MRILVGDGWLDGYPDEHRGAGQLRIRVAAHQCGERIRSLYFEQPRDPRRVWNYVREVGPAAVARKVVSRRRESARNEKHIGVGVGVVLECDADAAFSPGDVVSYATPAHPRGQERIVLAAGLCRAVEDGALTATVGSHASGPPVILPWEQTGIEFPTTLIGWSPHSGTPLDSDRAQAFLSRYEVVLRTALGAVPGGLSGPVSSSVSSGSSVAKSGEGAAQAEGDLPVGAAPDSTGAEWSATPLSEVRELRPGDIEVGAPTRGPAPIRATVMGYGHYAKISLIPNLDPGVAVTRVHEIDPTQLGRGPHRFVVDTAPRIREEADVFFLAGFHHTHAPLAAEALRRGAAAVIEKPIATTSEDLDELLAAMDASKGSVHVGFHKRYQPFNRWAREDLRAEPGDPVSYYAIAYEVPLPSHHWYRWPRSGSRLQSNGCHWVDHFLFLNHWSAPRSLDVAEFPSGDLSVRIVLENDAAFHMTLTDQGGARIGVQDHVELRRGNRTVRIRNGRSYESEDDRRILRRETENKTMAYRRMYRRISADIVNRADGDSRRSVEISARTVLELEARVNEQKGTQVASRSETETT